MFTFLLKKGGSSSNQNDVSIFEEREIIQERPFFIPLSHVRVYSTLYLPLWYGETNNSASAGLSLHITKESEVIGIWLIQYLKRLLYCKINRNNLTIVFAVRNI